MSFETISPVELRVLGSLIEKAMSTPEYYPLTLNALTTACNQRNNREPLMDLDEPIVLRAADELRRRKLVWQVAPAGARVFKYRHDLETALNVTAPALAILAELILRGPQTLSELRVRARRLHNFLDMDSVEQVLDQMANRADFPLVQLLPPVPGQREPRYFQLLGGKPDPALLAGPAPEPARLHLQASDERMLRLENEVAELRRGLAALEAEFTRFREQFE